MAEDQLGIESAPTPSIKSLKSRFEQLAQDNSTKNQIISPRQHDAHRELRKDSALPISSKRAPPPPPPSRLVKKPTMSPAISPLLRPVPVPAALRSPRVSPEHLSVDDDDAPRGGGVSSLRERFATAAASPHKASIKPAPRLSLLDTQSEPNVLHSTPPRPSSQLVASPEDTPSDEYFDAFESPRMIGVASLRNRFSAILHTPQSTPKPLPRNDHLTSNSEPNILASSPPITHRRPPPPPPPPHRSALFDTGDDFHHSSSNSSSTHSPFSDHGSETSLQSVTTRHTREYSDSSDSIASISPSHKPPSRLNLTVPPPPPPRRGANENSRNSSSSSTPTPNSPPPLPSRHLTPEDISDVPPSLPARHNMNTAAPASNDFISDRKPLGSNKLPPPPTRTIAPGDKLPPARRAHTPSSDEDSGAEDGGDDPRTLLPDASRASRRPPILRTPKIHLPAYAAQVAVASTRALVATHHHLRCFDLTRQTDVPIWVVDTREMGVRDAKVTALEFRARSAGGVVWAGTKEGHLVELDMYSGEVIGSKFGAHAGVVTHIFRHRNAMISVDESGKVLVFEPAATSGSDVPSLTFTAPRVYRTAEKQEFVKLLGGLLWTSVRSDTNGSGPTAVPIVKIYDVFTPGSIARNVSVLPNTTHHVGAVTSGTLLQSHPGFAYLGHEGGFISIWNLAAGPECTDIVKVSSSDVLSLEGVGMRLWAGGRTGVICAYDVSSRPWVVTNAWNAHSGLPVMRMFVDPWSIEKEEKLSVVSVGRDEQMRFWDGLLGIDWIGNELLKREREFSSFRTINVLVVSWNVDAAKPEALTDYSANLTFLNDALTSVSPPPDIISFGFQELIDLESRKMAAKTVLLGGKKKGEDGRISEKVTSSYRRWHDRLVTEVQALAEGYTVIHTESLVGLFTCMFVKNSERTALKDVAITTIKRGMGGRYGNKGGIVARFVIGDSSICFINCHLAAGQHHVRQRNADVTAMLEEKSVFPSSDAIDESLVYVGGGDGSMVLDHEIVFLNGDLNYRIDQRRDAVISSIQSGDLEALHTHDQLLKEMKHNRGFRLRSFHEGPLTFSLPTNTTAKKRVPAWCDRVLWRSRDPERVKQLHYRRYEANVSDHRPVSAAFAMTVKSVRLDAWAKEKAIVEEDWLGTLVELLADARDFYVEQALI
ncbi:Endonuclease/exonuclease/phosphatase [Suillus spraguei]|nr:Endonuclease/exonuclease/phosphatase [Suillus spraguei]